MASNEDRRRDRARKKEKRAQDGNVAIPWPKDMRRRRRLERDDERWLLWYFGEGSGVPDPFWYEFTEQQVEMIQAIRNAIISGGDQALAASRGEGKTTICERLLLKYTLQGVITFSVLFAATGEAAGDSLASIRDAIEENDRLADDYPEVCTPVRDLENIAQRANGMTASGKRLDNRKSYTMTPIKFSWCGREIVLPSVPGSPSRRAIIATRGLDAAVRGIKKKGRRVDVAVIDDPDTEETARSEEQADKLEKRIDRAIAGAGGQQRSVARVMLTTLQSRISASYKFTDPSQKPSFKGRRFRFLITPPERLDLWDEYVQLRAGDLQHGTNLADEFYAANFDAMNEGAQVSNPHRHTATERTALQHYYNLVAKLGPEAVATEYDNDPPEETGPIESGITAHRVQTQVSGYSRCVIPPECSVLTQGIDCQKRGLYWVVKAWRADGTGFVIDYNFAPTFGTSYDNENGVDRAIHRAILMHMEENRKDRYTRVDGEIMPVALTIIDARYQTAAVYQACRELGVGVLPGMGCGKSGGCARPSFVTSREPRDGFIPLDGSNCVEISKTEWPGLWRLDMDTDRWKAWLHDRWMTAPDRPGSMMLFGDHHERHGRLSATQREHLTFAKHLVAEIETEEFVRGVLQRKWVNKHERPNHYFDASYMACAAAAIKGIRPMRVDGATAASKQRPQPLPVDTTDSNDSPFLASAR